MEIQQVKNETVKIGKSSITIKDENGKTKGVVPNCTKFKDLIPNKQFDYFSMLKMSGIWGSRIDGLLDCVIVHNGQIYYLNNTRPLRNYEKYFSNESVFPNEKITYDLRLEIAEKAKQYFVVLDCIIL